MQARRPSAALSTHLAHRRRTHRVPPRAHVRARPPRAPAHRRRTESSRPTSRVALVSPCEKCARCARDDLQIEPGRPMLDVPDVELDSLVPRQLCAAVDLRPPGDTGPHFEAAPLTRRIPLYLIRKRGAGADQAHVAPHDVPQLRQLVDREPAQHAAGAGDARIALIDGEAGSLALRADLHRPQLDELELLAVEADPPLP